MHADLIGMRRASIMQVGRDLEYAEESPLDTFLKIIIPCQHKITPKRTMLLSNYRKND